MAKKLLVHEIDYRDYGYIDACSVDDELQNELNQLMQAQYSLCQ